MLAPHQKGVIQIDITNRCDLGKCSNCTRMLYYHQKRFNMSLDNFKRAIDSMAGYNGVIGIFGGNPCIHPQFQEISEYFEKAVPNKAQRGLWSNNVNGHGELIRRVYGYFNLNVHTNENHASEIRRDIPGVTVWGDRSLSWHSPTLVAIKDMIPEEGKMWELIEKCDVNLHWSGAITEINGNLRAYFCEIAAAFDHMYGEDNGLEVTPGWYGQPIQNYDKQIQRWCPNCGIPLKLKGHQDLDFVDDISSTHQDRVQLTIKGKNRKVQIHQNLEGQRTHEATDYMGLRKQNKPKTQGIRVVKRRDIPSSY